MNVLIVVDMQNDFITGSLGSEEAVKIVSEVVKKVKEFEGRVIFTRDTHFENYSETSEGKKLPVSHCIKNTDGWQICRELLPYAKEIVDKITFGSKELPLMLENPKSIELCGLCTDICVISNAVLLKAHFPEAEISVDSSCCAGVTTESHNNALKAMEMLHITIK